MPVLPNLLDTRKGRLAGFFLLYVCEGLPQGFTATAVVLEFKRMGMTGEAIGTFSALILLPWAWKWLMGPLVDNFHIKRFGRRKQWIVLAQIGMLATLVAAILNLPQPAAGGKEFLGLALFTQILLLHNIFAASQDVAIDALACSTLEEHERGLANGLMFAGAQVGAAIGGSGVLLMKSKFGFQTAAFLAPVVIAGILAIVVFLILERNSRTLPENEAHPHHHTFGHSLERTLAYLAVVLRVFFTTRRGILGLLLALVPSGGMALSLTVSNVLTPTLGMNDDEIAKMGIVCSVIFTVFCMTGGFLSDRFGRRLTLGLFSAGTLLPTLWMGWQLHSHGWHFPAPASPGGTWPRHEALITAWWAAAVVYSVFQGLMYGVRTAFFMDIVEPRIAATHFTACMALLNLVTIYSYWWEGKAITSVAENGWGLTYFQIFAIDAAIGSLFLLILPFLKPASKAANGNT
jgi:PAT family beta-lactamase induction signal transducer AmpG